MDTLLQQLWHMLTPSLGTLAIAAVGLGLLVGLMHTAVDKLGMAPVLLSIGGIVVLAWAAWYILRPADIQTREIAEPVVVEKIVPDTSSIDALKAQLEQSQRQSEELAVKHNEAIKRAAKAEAEIEHRDAPKMSAKAAFDEKYAESKVRPTYELASPSKSSQGMWLLTVRESRGDYLVTCIYEFTYGPLVLCKHVTVTIQDRNTQTVGRPARYMAADLIAYPPHDDKGNLDVQALLDGLADGTFGLQQHEEHVADHLKAVDASIGKAKVAQAEYLKRTQRTVEVIKAEEAEKLKADDAFNEAYRVGAEEAWNAMSEGEKRSRMESETSVMRSYFERLFPGYGSKWGKP